MGISTATAVTRYDWTTCPTCGRGSPEKPQPCISPAGNIHQPHTARIRRYEEEMTMQARAALEPTVATYTRDLKKGDMIRLRNGWKARIEDNNRRGLTRICTVWGIETEMGSVYAHDIVSLIKVPGSVDEPEQVEQITHTESQLKLKKSIELAHL